MNILALDIADKCGWAYGNIDHIESGTWKLKLRSDDSVGMRLVKLRRHLNEIREYGISLVVFERVAGRFKTDISRCSEKAGVVMEWCEAQGIPYYALSATEVKKFATGKGRASKDAMLNAAIHKFGVDCGKDHNRADALAIWHMAFSQYGDDDALAISPQAAAGRTSHDLERKETR